MCHYCGNEMCKDQARVCCDPYEKPYIQKGKNPAIECSVCKSSEPNSYAWEAGVYTCLECLGKSQKLKDVLELG